ncbi:MAG: hypothetical protein AB7P76_08965 [Candidatus Melainabacteria bacterium]
MLIALLLSLGLFSGCNDPKGFQKVYTLKQHYKIELKTAVLNDHQVLVIGSKGQGEVFDTQTHRSFLTPRIVPFHNRQDPIVAVRGIAYTITYNLCATGRPIECFLTSGAFYDPENNSAGILYGMPRARSKHTMHPLKNGNLLLIGGLEMKFETKQFYNDSAKSVLISSERQKKSFESDQKNPDNLLDILEVNPKTLETKVVGQIPEDPKWHSVFSDAPKESLKYLVGHGSVRVDENRYLILGGGIQKRRALDAIYLFDRSSGTVKLIGSFPVPLTMSTGLALNNHEVLIGGGYTPDYIHQEVTFGETTTLDTTYDRPLTEKLKTMDPFEILDLKTGKMTSVNDMTKSIHAPGGDIRLFRLDARHVISIGLHRYMIIDLKTNTVTKEEEYLPNYGPAAAGAFQMPDGSVYIVFRKRTEKNEYLYKYEIYKYTGQQ